MTNTYIDSINYLKQPTGLVLTTFVGNNSRLSSVALQGATSLTVPALGVALNQYDSVYVFDGPNSEQLQVGAGGAAQNATSIPLQAATAFQHQAGTVFCTDGTDGSLGEQIFIASGRIDNEICHQALWSTAYTGEILTMPTMRASMDNQKNLHFRPRHFPITALTSMIVMTNQQSQTSYDVIQAVIDSDQQTVDVPNVAAQTSGGQPAQGSPWVWPALKRETNAWMIINYTAGFAPGQLPDPVKRACTLLISDCFTPLENAGGADSITQGKRAVTFVIRGDLSGESTLYKRAKNLLQPYVMEGF
jgi:hypothetical protein